MNKYNTKCFCWNRDRESSKKDLIITRRVVASYLLLFIIIFLLAMNQLNVQEKW